MLSTPFQLTVPFASAFEDASSVGSAYGAAGSVIVVIVWVYYSAQIFFFGAEFTYAYTEHQLPVALDSSAAKGHSTAA
jgi:uncharacterized BrkB/YihY/UPF0761 family membrane protein